MRMKLQPIDSSVVQGCNPAWMASYRAVALRCMLTFLVVAAFARSVPAASPVTEETKRLLAQVEPRIKAIYETNEFATRSFEATWLPDGSGYLKLETPAGAAGAEIVRYDSASGQRTVVVAGEKLLVPGSDERLMIWDFVRSPAGDRYLLHTQSTSGEHGSNHWLYEPETGALHPVEAGSGAWFGADAFSPDGKRLQGSRGADLIAFDIASGRTTRLTQDGDPGTVDNGSAVGVPTGNGSPMFNTTTPPSRNGRSLCPATRHIAPSGKRATNGSAARLPRCASAW